MIADRRLSLAALTELLVADGRREITLRVSGLEIAEIVDAFRPAVCLLDMTPESLAASPVQLADPTRLLVLLDLQESSATFVDAVRSGAGSFLARSASPDGLESAIDRVSRVGSFIDPLLARSIWKASEDAPRQSSGLSRRESEILGYVARGHSSKQIARSVGVSAKTVCNHVSNIYAKLNLQHRGQLVLYAAHNGLAPV